MGDLEVALNRRDVSYSSRSASFLRVVHHLTCLHVACLLAVTLIMNAVFDRGVTLRLFARLTLRVV